MMIKFLTNLLTIIILGIVQVSFLTTWPVPIRNLNLILSLVIFLIVINRYQQGLWWAFGGGLFLELFSFKIFGLTTFSLLLTAIIINFLFSNFFTNYSFYSLTALGVVGTVGYNLLILIGNALISFFGFTNWLTTLNFTYLIWQLILNLIILYIIFFIFHFLSGRLKMELSSS